MVSSVFQNGHGMMRKARERERTDGGVYGLVARGLDGRKAGLAGQAQRDDHAQGVKWQGNVARGTVVRGRVRTGLDPESGIQCRGTSYPTLIA